QWERDCSNRFFMPPSLTSNRQYHTFRVATGRTPCLSLSNRRSCSCGCPDESNLHRPTHSTHQNHSLSRHKSFLPRQTFPAHKNGKGKSASSSALSWPA